MMNSLSLIQRIQNARRGQWIRFAIVALLYLLFIIWDNNYWLLLGMLLIFDIYITKFIPWGAWKKSKNPTVRKIAEWTDAIVFALIAVYFINLFIFQNYKIPTSSLEKTLLVGDYLFVSKMSYGPRVPNTPLSFPLTQHTLPILNCKSYLEWPHWDYKRLKGFGSVERNDIVVFNFPAGDTVALKAQNSDYYSIVEAIGWEAVNKDKYRFGDIVYRPVDRRENYVKRCVGMPGDSLQIINNDLYIDGVKQARPKHVQFNYFVETQGGLWNDRMFKSLGVSKDDRWLRNPSVAECQMLGIQPNESGQYNPVYLLPLTDDALQQLKKSGAARSITIEPYQYGGPCYPYGYETGWNQADFGPIFIPKRGATIQLNELNLALYKRCIVNYEGNKMEVNGNQILINGTPATSYTFKYDYYFMMGDNRHNSLDSRAWGFVPEDHIVGKPILIWLSLDKDYGIFDGGIRWERIFRFVKNEK